MANTHFLLASTTASISLILLFLSPLITASTPVLDLAGNPLEPGSKYYFSSAFWGAGSHGGVSAAPWNNTCPLYVRQHGWWWENGMPVTFTPTDSTQKEITLGMEVNLSFGPNSCENEGIWKVTQSSDGVFFVTNDGVRGPRNSSLEAFQSTFQIRQTLFGWAYEIVFCFLTPAPAIWPPLPPGPENCQTVADTVRGSNGLSWLGLVPMHNTNGFTFRKVEEGRSTTY